MQEEKTNWFELDNLIIDTSNYNSNFEILESKLQTARKIDNQSKWNWDYIKISAKLTFRGSLETPRGPIETNFDYIIKTDYDKLINKAEISIYEQTFTGLNEAVTIHFSSGSIISKIVFGDIEQAFTSLKEQVRLQVIEYNKKVDEFNLKIKELKEAKEEKEKESNEN